MPNTHSNKKPYSPLVKYGTYIVLILLIITFVGAPIISNNLSQGQALIFGKYGKYEIKYDPDNYFGRLVQTTLEQYSQEYPEMAQNNFFISTAWRQSYNQTVLRYALLELAEQSHFTPSPDYVKNIITTYEYLQQDGAFSRELYNSLTDSTKQNLIQDQFDQSTVNKIYTDIISPAYLSKQELQFYTDLNNDKHSFEYVRFNKYDTKDEDLLRQYGKNNSELFNSIHYRSITVGTKAEAETIYNNILNQESTFEESISAFSIDSAKDNAGDRGTSFAYQIEKSDGKETLEAILALPDTDSITKPIETSTGNFSIYQLVDTIKKPDFDSATLTDETVENEDDTNQEQAAPSILNEVKNYLSAYDPGIIEDSVNELATQFIEKATQTSFSSSASTYNLEVGTIPLAPLNVNNIALFSSITSEDGPGIDNLSSEQDILAKMYSLQENEISDPFVIGGNIYVFKVTDIESTLPTNSKEAASISEEDRTRIIDFIKATNENEIREAVIDEKKYTNSFDEAYNRIYSQ